MPLTVTTARKIRSIFFNVFCFLFGWFNLRTTGVRVGHFVRFPSIESYYCLEETTISYGYAKADLENRLIYLRFRPLGAIFWEYTAVRFYFSSIAQRTVPSIPRKVQFLHYLSSIRQISNLGMDAKLRIGSNGSLAVRYPVYFKPNIVVGQYYRTEE